MDRDTPNEGPVAVPLMDGPLQVHVQPDGQSIVLEFPNPTGPVRVAMRRRDIGQLIIAAGHVLGPEMPAPGHVGQVEALTTSRWTVTSADPARMLVSFQILSGSSLTFLIDKTEGPAMIEAIGAALGGSGPDPVPPRALQN